MFAQLLKLFLLLLTGGALVVACGLPLYVDALVILLWFSFLATTRRYFEASLALGSVTIALLLVSFVVGSSAWLHERHYREHEKHVRNGNSYQPNVRDVIDMPHGDLVALDPLKAALLAAPRRVHFVTDARGYRNSRAYAGESVILNGDSFVVSNGSDQSDTLAELLREQGWPSYSIAFPSNPVDYEERARNSLEFIVPAARFVMFFYEGNDFDTSKEPTPRTERSALLTSYDEWKQKVLKELLSPFALGQVLFNMSRRLELQYLYGVEAPVTVAQIGSRWMGFLDSQSQHVFDAKLRLTWHGFEDVWARVACVFFIPTKLRVYAPWLDKNLVSGMTEPAYALTVLSEKLARFGLPVVDLTPALVAAARNERTHDRFIYWPDDSHWNGLGVRAVLPEVTRCLGAAFERGASEPR